MKNPLIRSLLAPATALFALALISTAHAATPVAAPATLRVGAVAPDFVMKNLAGADVRLSDYKDKVVVLDFWATWCGPCKKVEPLFNALARTRFTLTIHYNKRKRPQCLPE